MNKDPYRKIKILNFITKYGEEHHKAPTMREIKDGVGLSSLASLWWHLEILGFVIKGDKPNAKNSWWRKNKEEFMAQWRCPTCQRDLYGDKR